MYKNIYIANKLEPKEDENHNQYDVYDVPFSLGKLNYQPLQGNDLQAYMSAYGETKNKLVRLYLDINYQNKFKEFDLAYLYGATPTGETVNGENANYFVKTYAPQNTVVMVVFEEIIKGE